MPELSRFRFPEPSTTGALAISSSAAKSPSSKLMALRAAALTFSAVLQVEERISNGSGRRDNGETGLRSVRVLRRVVRVSSVGDRVWSRKTTIACEGQGQREMKEM